MSTLASQSFRTGSVFLEKNLAGKISETDSGYRFKYDQKFLNSKHAMPISLTLPLQINAFDSKILFPFFDGLIPEGWLLNIAEKTWKLNPRDRMGLLLTCCEDCIGNIHIKAEIKSI